MNKHYCSQKFWWLSVNLQRMETMSCCAADPEKLNHSWLANNPGRLFNTEKMQNERHQMLSGERVQSCEATCWHAEDAGMTSRRTSMNSDRITHTEIDSTPEIIHIILGNQCNMTCSYCCKQYSSAWYNDIEQNGSYETSAQGYRFKITTKDRLLSRISQKKIMSTEMTNFTIRELQKIAKSKKIKKFEITGGEPLLYLGLENLVKEFETLGEINIWSGLGVNTTRLENELKKIKKYHKNIKFTISAENTKSYYEFNRAGNTWQRFKDNLDCLEKNKINVEFNSTLSNITIFGLHEFETFAERYHINYQPCNDPDFLSIGVLDDETKSNVLSSLHKLGGVSKKLIYRSIDKKPTELQHKNFSNYIIEFAKRRNKSLKIFPKSLLNWIGYNV